VGLELTSRRYKRVACIVCDGRGWIPVKLENGKREYNSCDYCGGTGVEA